jgi:hypothetical protein
MREKAVATSFAVAGLLAAGLIIFLSPDWWSGEIRLAIAMWVGTLTLFPLVRMFSSEKSPPLVYLWRDRTLTFWRYTLAGTVMWTLFAVIITLLRRLVG